MNAAKLWVRINRYIADGWPYVDNSSGDYVLRISAGVLEIYDQLTQSVIYRSAVAPPFTDGQVIECSRVAEQTKIIRDVYYYSGD